MKVSGFTFIRNALIYDYPIVEAIKSIMPICDEVVVAVGNSDDDTLELVKNLGEKIRIIETTWDDTLREGGRVLAVETDKAFAAISEDSDWAFYIQGDEVVHEKYLPAIKNAMIKYKDSENIDGLLFNYLHFYGSYDFVGASSAWYRHEIRVIKNNKLIRSYKDAQGFRIGKKAKLKVRPIDAYVYHYGWVREPKAMQRKQETFNRLWHDDEWVEKNIVKAEEFDYASVLSKLEKFSGTHPKVIQERIEKINWHFKADISFTKLSFKDKVKNFARKYMGINLGYKGYKVVKRA